ncbi:hypothetical protein, partial [Chitinophaga sancti]|uniref:hypothetical protein n=1 Tax=Chitinophaga sancti TaxID=1004 RepID=UPI003F7920A1
KIMFLCYALRLYIPRLQAKEHPDRINLSFQEFIDDKPTIANVEYETENKVVRFFHKDTNKTHFDKFRGVRKNGTLTKQYKHEHLLPVH